MIRNLTTVPLRTHHGARHRILGSWIGMRTRARLSARTGCAELTPVVSGSRAHGQRFAGGACQPLASALPHCSAAQPCRATGRPRASRQGPQGGHFQDARACFNQVGSNVERVPRSHSKSCVIRGFTSVKGKCINQRFGNSKGLRSGCMSVDACTMTLSCGTAPLLVTPKTKILQFTTLSSQGRLVAPRQARVHGRGPNTSFLHIRAKDCVWNHS